MKQLSIHPTIHKFDSAREFADAFHLGKGDVVLANRYLWEPYFGSLQIDCTVIYQEEFGQGEPSDTMVDAIMHSIESAQLSSKKTHKKAVVLPPFNLPSMRKHLLIYQRNSFLLQSHYLQKPSRKL